MRSVSRKASCDEPLLLWAVRDSDIKRFVHIGMLSPFEKGAACKCLCRSCGERLLAINVDKPPEHFERRGTQRRHYKHRHTSSEETRCLSKVARLLALQLFVEQGVVFLPARTRPVSRQLPNGHLVADELAIPAEWAPVRSRVWVDDHSAVLMLEDGRELLVTVRAHHVLDDKLNSTCVLSLAGIKDPKIATWDTEKILEHLRVSGCGLSWDRHWGDDDLKDREAAALLQSEEQFLGGIPREWLEGLDGKQFSETILHWVIKRAIAVKGEFYVPAMSVDVHKSMPDGSESQEAARCPAMLLLLQDIRLERRLGNMVPDVICRARRADGRGASFDLMIEAAVTNYIDQAKTQKIKLAGIACIQIRADRFTQSGKVPVAEIEEVVWSDTSVKQWIVHPWIDEEIKKTRRRLDAQANEIRRAMEAEARKQEERERKAQEEKERQEKEQEKIQLWINGCDERSLLRAYVKVLKASWTGEAMYLVGEKAGTHQALWKEMVRRKLVHDNRAVLESTSGLLRMLLQLEEEPSHSIGTLAVGRLRAAINDYMEDPHNSIVLMFALAKRRLEMLPSDTMQFDGLCTTLREKVGGGLTQYQRNTENDRLFAMLFPSIAADIASEYGTSDYYAKMRVQKQLQVAHEKRRAARKALVRSGRQRQGEEKRALAVKSALDAVAGTLKWRDFPFGDPSPVQLYAQHNGKARLQGLSVLEFYKKAEQYRKQRDSVDNALRAMSFTTEKDVASAVSLLLHAKLCVDLSSRA